MGLDSWPRPLRRALPTMTGMIIVFLVFGSLTVAFEEGSALAITSAFIAAVGLLGGVALSVTTAVWARPNALVPRHLRKDVSDR